MPATTRAHEGPPTASSSVKPAPLWSRLYLMVWLLFGETVVIMFGGSHWVPYWTHIALGLAVIGLATANARALAATAAPARTKRVAGVIARFAWAQLVIGGAMGLGINPNLGLSWVGVLGALHVTAGLAMITQASSVATSYDMWEEREFEPAPGPGALAGAKDSPAAAAG